MSWNKILFSSIQGNRSHLSLFEYHRSGLNQIKPRKDYIIINCNDEVISKPRTTLHYALILGKWREKWGRYKKVIILFDFLVFLLYFCVWLHKVNYVNNNSLKVTITNKNTSENTPDLVIVWLTAGP